MIGASEREAQVRQNARRKWEPCHDDDDDDTDDDDDDDDRRRRISIHICFVQIEPLQLRHL